MDPAFLHRCRVCLHRQRLDISFLSTFSRCPSGLSVVPAVLCTEVLACNLRSSSGIAGVHLPNSAQELRVSGYADYTTVVITTDKLLPAVFTVYRQYEVGSGAMLNRSKSKGLWLGAWKHHSDALAGLDWYNTYPCLVPSSVYRTT